MSNERKRLLVVADRARRLYWRLYGPRTVGVRVVVRNRDGDVCLVRHTYGDPYWHLPGGGVRRRETIDSAARREAKEETGIRAADGPDAMRLYGIFSNLREGKSDHIVIFEVCEWEQGSDPDDPEIAEVAWFPPSSPPDDASPGTKRRLAEIANGTRPGFRW